MSDHKRVGLHRAFSPSGLSAAPGSNIHLAWCIPGLETLMWFVGESRWQVHGSTLLTDSAGASGRVHNNTECLSPPSFCILSNHTSYPLTLPSAHIFLFFFFSYHCAGAGILQREPFDMLTHRSVLSVLRSLVSSLFFPQCLLLFSVHASLSLTSYCLCFLYTSSLSYFITVTPTPTRHTRAHAPWIALPPTCPLSSSSFGSHSLHRSLSSFLFLHLFCCPRHSSTEHVRNYWKFDVLSSLSSIEMMSCNKSKSINIR